MQQYTYSIRTPLGNWLGFEGVFTDFPGITWVECRCQRRTFTVTKPQALAFLAYVRTVTPDCKLVRIGASE